MPTPDLQLRKNSFVADKKRGKSCCAGGLLRVRSDLIFYHAWLPTSMYQTRHLANKWRRRVAECQGRSQGLWLPRCTEMFANKPNYCWLLYYILLHLLNSTTFSTPASETKQNRARCCCRISFRRSVHNIPVLCRNGQRLNRLITQLFWFSQNYTVSKISAKRVSVKSSSCDSWSFLLSYAAVTVRRVLSKPHS